MIARKSNADIFAAKVTAAIEDVNRDRLRAIGQAEAKWRAFEMMRSALKGIDSFPWKNVECTTGALHYNLQQRLDVCRDAIREAAKYS